MNEELRIRSSVEAIRRRMSGIRSRKARIVLIFGVACICVGLGALAVIVQKPATFYGTLDFLGIPHGNGSEVFPGSSGNAKALVHGSGNASIVLSPAASDNASSSLSSPTVNSGSSSSRDMDGDDETRAVSSNDTSDSAKQKALIHASAQSVTVLSNITPSSSSPKTRAPALSSDATTAAVADINNSYLTITTSLVNSSTDVELATPKNLSLRSNVTSRMAYLVVGTDGFEKRRERPQILLVEVDTGTSATTKGEAHALPATPPAAPHSELADGPRLWYYIDKPENSTSSDAEDDVLVVGDETEKP